MNLLDLVVKISAEDNASRQVNSVANNVMSNLGNASKGITAFGVAFGNVMSNVVTAGWNKFTSGIDAGINRVDTLNQFRDSMIELGESTEAASDSVSLIRKGLDGLPSSTADIASFVGQIKATGPGLEDATKMGLAFNDAMLAGGKGTEAAARAQEAYTKALSKGSFDADQWFSLVSTAPAQMNQLSESILGAGATYSDLFDAMKSGSVSIEQFNQALIENGDMLHKQAQANTKGIATSMQNFQSRIGQAWANIIEAIDPVKIATLLDSISMHFSNLGKDIGSAIKPAADAFFSFVEFLDISDKMAEFEEASGRAATTTERLGMMFDNLKDKLSQIDFAGIISNALSTASQKIQESLDNLTGVIGNFNFSDMFNEGDGGISEAIMQMFSAIDPQGLFDSFMNLRQAIMEMLAENLPPMIEEFGTMLGEALPSLIEYILGLLQTIGENLISNISEFLPIVIDTLVGFISNFVGALTENAPQMFDAAVEFFSTMLDALVENLPTILDGLVQGILSLIDMIIENGPELLVAAGEFFLNILTAIVTNLPGILAALAEGLASLVAGVIEKAPDMLAAGLELIMKLLEAIGNALPDILNGLGNLLRQAVDSVGGFVGDMLNAGANLIQGLIDGVLGGIGGLTDAVLGGLGGMVDSAMNFLGIASPSKLFKELGNFTMQGMAIGIEADASKAEQAMRDAAAAVYGAASGTVDLGVSAEGAMAARGLTIYVNIDRFENRTTEDIRTLANRIGEYTEFDLRARGYA